jgi:Mor family transcriptional regulator
MITPRDIFEAFFAYCQEHSIEEVIKEYGGGTIYVPSYKSTHRDADLCKRYREGATMPELIKEFHLSESRIRKILRKMPCKKDEPSLFETREERP